MSATDPPKGLVNTPGFQISMVLLAGVFAIIAATIPLWWKDDDASEPDLYDGVAKLPIKLFVDVVDEPNYFTAAVIQGQPSSDGIKERRLFHVTMTSTGAFPAIAEQLTFVVENVETRPVHIRSHLQFLKYPGEMSEPYDPEWINLLDPHPGDTFSTAYEWNSLNSSVIQQVGLDCSPEGDNQILHITGRFRLDGTVRDKPGVYYSEKVTASFFDYALRPDQQDEGEVSAGSESGN